MSSRLSGRIVSIFLRRGPWALIQASSARFASPQYTRTSYMRPANGRRCQNKNRISDDQEHRGYHRGRETDRRDRQCWKRGTDRYGLRHRGTASACRQRPLCRQTRGAQPCNDGVSAILPLDVSCGQAHDCSRYHQPISREACRVFPQVRISNTALFR